MKHILGNSLSPAVFIVRVPALLCLLSLFLFTQCQKPCGPVPTENQLRWQDMEMYAFIHYSLNTYTDQEWGFGNEDLQLFNPSQLDCRQWARVCKQAGKVFCRDFHGDGL